MILWSLEISLQANLFDEWFLLANPSEWDTGIRTFFFPLVKEILEK